MDTTFVAPMGDRGRLVIPAELRARQHWDQGVPLLMIEAEGGVVLLTREQAKALIRSQLEGQSVLEALLAERRAAAAQDDAA
ncbi:MULTISPECIES: AbrB/MazE/SpoVT family DNA-binding domain-containing protein [Microbacterium]|jgi:bifunctional DNA-binding transcriptional regulator/antitoxin component of YhaV-PrlF toxin-antitoxin module|uniref:AbrB/MazE/SpoVT family DNA-binding domain-containing protein n=1 Tax=Microbacterium paraoxydans TaxID=199592 RepID=A0ABZ2HQD2_9MICO|nr:MULTISPECIES: AbrB/MazE/SpoVT family DNA-binding domain-containing protein [Microbacterium]AMG83823.1 cell division protein MraZ [Microbacterium sp. PAMC 28756]OSP04804.1 cell division protein MraZ [Microbacterium sp. LEMMJ01]QXE30703.1 AbrB/MazE/SpoVT family DNA-binding domain-containing protein [Microbacterium paraoxydans]RUQ04328.1 AbrB/MazE/SpoVT family DNA-binding domain-containing protein [Microbacterium sp. HSID17254]